LVIATGRYCRKEVWALGQKSEVEKSSLSVKKNLGILEKNAKFAQELKVLLYETGLFDKIKHLRVVIFAYKLAFLAFKVLLALLLVFDAPPLGFWSPGC